MKKTLILVLLLVVALFGLHARDNFSSFGFVYNVTSQSLKAGGEKGTISLKSLGLEAAAFSFENEFVASGFYGRVKLLFPNEIKLTSSGTSVSFKAKDLFDSSFIMNTSFGYVQRWQIAKGADFLLGVGPSLQMEMVSIGSQSDYSLVMGLGATAEVKYEINPGLALHAGLGADLGLFKIVGDETDLSGSGVSVTLPFSISPFIGLGFNL